MKKLLSAALVLILVTAAFSGCNAAKDQKKNNIEASKPSETEQSKTKTDSALPGNSSEKKQEDNSKAASSKFFKANLYFHDKESMSVIKEERDITVDSETLDTIQKAEVCIEELVKGSTAGLLTSIPKSTKVMSIKQDNDTLIVDLSRDFESDHNGGSAGVLMTMAQLVLTLTEIEGVQHVSFKIEGRTLEDFKGSIEFNKPFDRNEYEQYLKK